MARLGHIKKGDIEKAIGSRVSSQTILCSDSHVSYKGFAKELKQCIIPFTGENYRVSAGSKNQALAGLFMGGIQTLYAGINYTELFSYLGVISWGWIQPMQKKLADSQYQFMKQNSDKINHSLKQFFIAMGGREDIAYNNRGLMLSEFDEMKIKYTYGEYSGGHTWPVCRNYLYNFAQVLFK